MKLMVGRKTLWAACFALSLVPVAGISTQEREREARDWLERMLEAARTIDYEGTFVYVQDQNVETMHILHSSDSEGKRQRLYSLNGAPREVLVMDNLVTCLLPTDEIYVTGASYNRSGLPIALPQELSRLESNYRFDMIGEDRTAGLTSQVIAIEPRDRFRFGYRLWLDSATAMLLRSALLNEDGRVLEQLMFTSLQIKPEIDSTKLIPPGFSESPSQPAKHPIGEPITDSQWAIERLPQGFVQVLHNRYSSASDDVTEHIVLTDGLATVSVFLEKLNGAKPLLEGASHMGAMNAYGLVINGHQVTVVGEVPEVTVELIATSMQHADGGS